MTHSVAGEYRFVRVFETTEEFEQWWIGTDEQEGEKINWRKLHQHENKGSESEYWRCQFAK